MVRCFADCFIGVGSNQDEPLRQVQEAIKKVAALAQVQVIAVSSFYSSAPVGFVCEDWFVNCVLRLATSLPPARLLIKLQNIENALGRRGRHSRAKSKYEARIIDLDLLLYNELIVDEDFLSLPHPRLHERRFVLEPLCELMPALRHPLLGTTMAEILATLEDEHPVTRLEIGTN